MPDRRRLPLILAILSMAFLLWLWLLSNQIRQMQIIFTYATFLVGGSILLGRRLSRRDLSLKQRFAPLRALMAVLLLLFASVRFRGLTGDWIPIVEWRWSDSIDWSSLATGPTGTPSGSRQEVDLSFPAAYSGFLGPDRTSTVTGLALVRDWDAHPPRLVWQHPVGKGWAGFSIADDIAYTIEQRDDEEVVVAYDLETGRQLWTHSDRAYFSNAMGGPGPRTTPGISQQRVFTLGATGILNALDRRTGELLWQHNIVEENDADLPEHGKSGSPLLVDGLVVVNPGGPNGHSLVAYDQESGEKVWHGGDDAAAFAAPQLATLAGRRQILTFNAASVAAHSPEDGRVLWQHPWPSNYPNAAPPLVIDEERVMFSTGYGIGAKMLRITITASDDQGGRLTAELLWETPRMKAKFANLVVYEGFIYGLDDGVLVCLDPDTGERRWKRGRYGHGNILLVDDVLLVQTEKGELVMIDPNPDELREITRFMALKGKAWNHFALVDPYLLVRNDREAALWEMPVLEEET